MIAGSLHHMCLISFLGDQSELAWLTSEDLQGKSSFVLSFILATVVIIVYMGYHNVCTTNTPVVIISYNTKHIMLRSFSEMPQ